MNRLWIKALKKHKPIADQAVPCQWGEQKEALRDALRDMDYPCPVWLGKHERDFDSFRRVVFHKEDFMEEVPFELLEVEFLDDTEKKRRSEDPRNLF